MAGAGVWAIGSKWSWGTWRREGRGQCREDPGGLGRDAGPLLAARQGSGRGDAHPVALLGAGRLGGREGHWNGVTGTQPASSRPDSRVPFLELFVQRTVLEREKNKTTAFWPFQALKRVSSAFYLKCPLHHTRNRRDSCRSPVLGLDSWVCFRRPLDSIALMTRVFLPQGPYSRLSSLEPKC